MPFVQIDKFYFNPLHVQYVEASAIEVSENIKGEGLKPVHEQKCVIVKLVGDPNNKIIIHGTDDAQAVTVMLSSGLDAIFKNVVVE